MNQSLEKLQTSDKEKTPGIFNMLPVPLSNIPFHDNTPAITRYFAERFPVYMAVHEINPVIIAPEEYTQPHVHNDFDEVNMIISKDNLLYKIQIGKDEFTVRSNSCIWIPRGTVHAANVLRGSGYLITMRIN